jgi:hypothetical protein
MQAVAPRPAIVVAGCGECSLSVGQGAKSAVHVIPRVALGVHSRSVRNPRL